VTTQQVGADIVKESHIEELLRGTMSAKRKSGNVHSGRVALQALKDYNKNL
jgi:hypothetical protein